MRIIIIVIIIIVTIRLTNSSICHIR